MFFPDEVVGLPCTILDMSKLFGQGGGVHGLLRLAGNCAGGSHDSNLDLKLLWKRYYMARGMIFNYLGVEGDDCLNFSFAYFWMLLLKHIVAASNILAFSAGKLIFCPPQYCWSHMFDLFLRTREWN